MFEAEGKFSTAPDDAIMRGTCVVISEECIIYAGPIKSTPDVTGHLVLLNPVDFEQLKAHVEQLLQS